MRRKKNENLMQIGEVARLSDVNIQTLRYYERRKILIPVSKLDSGYRMYNEDSIKTVAFIKHAQELGFSLDEIQDLLKLRNSSPKRSECVRKRAAEKLHDIREKIDMLQKMEQSLKRLISDCKGNRVSGACPIIENLEE